MFSAVLEFIGYYQALAPHSRQGAPYNPLGQTTERHQNSSSFFPLFFTVCSYFIVPQFLPETTLKVLHT